MIFWGWTYANYGGLLMLASAPTSQPEAQIKGIRFLTPDRIVTNSIDMKVKLTLHLEKAIIEKAKRHAKLHGTSVLKLIEDYLESISAPDNKPERITPLVRSLSGILDLPDEFGHKRDYRDYLSQKLR
jgi:hypothetical protein